MKKFVVAAMLAAVLSPSASAVETEGDDTGLIWGLKVGFDINTPGKWHVDNGSSVKMYRHGYGVTAGAVCNIYLGRNFYLEPGVSLYYDSYSHHDLFIVDADGTELNRNPSLYKLGVRIPVVVGYSIGFSPDFSMSVYTGPELSYSFAGNIRSGHEDLLPDQLFGGYQRRVDCAWKVGVGFPINRFVISVDGAIGMTDLLKSPGVSFRENRITVGGTYYF